MNVTIIGGGIAGLATAHSLLKHADSANLPVSCTLLESTQYFGGKIRTELIDDFIIEGGPDSFLSYKPWGVGLCRELGLGDRLMGTNTQHHRTYVLYNGRLREFPEGLVTLAPSQALPLFMSPLLSMAGKFRLVMDLFVAKPPANGADESLASFFRRRFGAEVFERLIEPLMTGIYAGDAEQLSLKATFPRFLEFEQQYGSIIKGMLASRRQRMKASPGTSAKLTTFVTLRGGLVEMVRALVASLESVGKEKMFLRNGVTVTALTQSASGKRPKYDVKLDTGESLFSDAVVLATPAYTAADLFMSLDPVVAEQLRAIPYTSTATVSLAYSAASLSNAHSLKGFGFVVPRVENRPLVASTWTSTKWAHRSPSDHSLIRCYLGGVGREDVVFRDDQDIVHLVRDELRDILGITADPVLSRVYRWTNAIPQYLVGHLDRLVEIEERLMQHPGLCVTGSAYRGVGLPDCIHEGDLTAKKLVDYFLASGAVKQ